MSSGLERKTTPAAVIGLQYLIGHFQNIYTILIVLETYVSYTARVDGWRE